MNGVLLCAAAAVAPASPPLGAPRSMWRAVEAACSRGECARHSNTTTAIKNTTDCYGRLLTYDYALTAIPALAPMREAFDSLELKGCGIHPPSQSTPRRVSASNAAGGATVYVDATRGSDVNAGTEAKPVQTIAHALLLARAAAGPPAATIILRAGTHFLAETVDLTPTDSGLTIKAYTGEDAAISGGVPLRDLTWSRASSLGNDGAATSPNVWKATLSKAVKPFISLGTLSPHRRVTRARYPNADPEIQSIWNPAEAIKIWQHDLSCAGKAQVVYKDLREGCGMSERDALDAGTRPCKNDSAMWDTYNTFANGHGGCCATWAGDGSPYGPMGDYFCGNSSAGGWVGFADIRGKNRTQGLSPMLPTGFIYNATLAPWLAKVADLEGALVHVWRDQGWFVTMYRVAEHDVKGSTVTFGRRPDGVVDGGWQGGRGMQIDAAALKDPTQSYLILGGWFIENAKGLLDAPNEYYLETATNTLYYWPNATNTEEAAPNSPPSKDVTLVATQLKTLIAMNATMSQPIKDITLEGITFRDAADIAMEPWAVPSGGDWGLHRGGAIFIEGCENCVVTHCTFTRIDGNGVMLSGYTRGATVADSTFEWLGHSAVAAWGYTDEDDGTGGQQPRGSQIVRNYVREIGLIQKQSSAFFQAKSCENNVSHNVLFNGPRAAINLNDGFGGGGTISGNAIWNQCRETGDHGPINSWDRQPFLTKVATGGTIASYAAAMTSVDHNLIIANYGASQGFDTDDGSSWYDIHHNFFFQSDGWKMDYGGHDSKFTDNVVYGGNGQNCFNAQSFLPSHGVEWSRNKCALTHSKTIGESSGCKCPGVVPHSAAPGTSSCGLTLKGNEYFLVATGSLGKVNASIGCSGDGVTFEEWQGNGSDVDATLSTMPSDELLVSWGRALLGMPALPGPVPPNPGPLPPAPTPHFPHTCQGQCNKAGFGCVGATSGCNQPSCAQGCLIANATRSAKICAAACKSMVHQCTWTVLNVSSGKNVTLDECNSCTFTSRASSYFSHPYFQGPDGVSSCEGEKACDLGCTLFFNTTAPTPPPTAPPARN